MSEWLNLTRVTAPTDPIISLEEAKAHLRITHDDEDDLLEGLIATATAFIEGPNGCGIALLTQVWRKSLNSFPSDGIAFPLGPVQAVDGITYVDLAGDTQTLSPALYTCDLDSTPCRIARAYEASWPVARPTFGAIKVTATVGFGDEPADIPADIRHAALLLIGHLYLNTEAVVGVAHTVSPSSLPWGVDAVLNRYRASGIA